MTIAGQEKSSQKAVWCFQIEFFSVRDVKQWLPGDTMCFTANRS
jgi:hypothetical protein